MELLWLLLPWTRVETERQKHRSRAFRALKFSIRAILSTIFDFQFSIRAISSRKIVEHFEHCKISSKTEHFSSKTRHFSSIKEFNLLSTSISGKYFNNIENLCVHFDQKYEKHICFSFSQPKKHGFKCPPFSYVGKVLRIYSFELRPRHIR